MRIGLRLLLLALEAAARSSADAALRRSSPCARLVLLMHSLERADNWRSIIGNYTQQHSVCSILIIWNNVNVSMPEVLRSAFGQALQLGRDRRQARPQTVLAGDDP